MNIYNTLQCILLSISRAFQYSLRTQFSKSVLDDDDDVDEDDDDNVGAVRVDEATISPKCSEDKKGVSSVKKGELLRRFCSPSGCSTSSSSPLLYLDLVRTQPISSTSCRRSGGTFPTSRRIFEGRSSALTSEYFSRNWQKSCC